MKHRARDGKVSWVGFFSRVVLPVVWAKVMVFGRVAAMDTSKYPVPVETEPHGT
jgi:hypothetical protein